MGLCLRKCLAGGAQFALWHITESEADLAALTASGMDAEEEDYVRKVRNAALRKEKLSVLALKDALTDGGCHLRHHPGGRPFLEGPPLNISITHTKDYAAVIVSRGSEVGIDIEAAGRNFNAVERAALSDKEISRLCPDREQRNLQLGIIWCAKESVYKVIGPEVYDYAGKIEILPFVPEEEGRLTAVVGERKMNLHYTIIFGHILVLTERN